jgi:hypothetical protein
MILDVRANEFIRGTPKIPEVGWNIVPIFFKRDTKVYIRSGYF